VIAAAVRPDGSLLTEWEVDASDALPATLAPGLDKWVTLLLPLLMLPLLMLGC
jgi:hypothetical protein